MTKCDPIIAVVDVEKSSNWYQNLLACSSMHGGSEFDVLVDEEGSVLLCLHKWAAHGHPSMKDTTIPAGNGLILYFRTTELETIRKRADIIEATIESDIQLNPNSHKREFSLRDPDGYFLTISEFHDY